MGAMFIIICSYCLYVQIMGLCLHFGDYIISKGRVKSLFLVSSPTPLEIYEMVFEPIVVSCNRIITEYISDSLVPMCVYSVWLWEVYINFLHKCKIEIRISTHLV